MNATIILCRPEGSLNVGSVCRAMLTMGFTDLRIVGTSPAALNEDEVKLMAVHAYSIYQSASFFSELSEALSDIHISGGVSRRKGKSRKQFFLLPEQFPEFCTGEGRAALVFGNEKNGLNELEMSLCTYGVSIPSSPSCPSLNLSHAVQVLTYVMHRREGKETGYLPAGKAAVENLTDRICRGIIDEGATDSVKELRPLLGNLLTRASVSPGEIKKIGRLFDILRYKS